MKDFHDADHANNRLTRCLVAIKDGAKVRIEMIDGADRTNFTTSRGGVYPIRSDDVQYIFPSLGYINTRLQCSYLTRSSKRMWKVGLTRDNLLSELLFPRYAHRADELPKEQALDRFLNVPYPSFKKALSDVLEGKVAARAFSTKFAFGLHETTYAACLYYKNKYIGFWNVKESKIEMGDSNAALIEQIREAAGKKQKLEFII